LIVGLRFKRRAVALIGAGIVGGATIAVGTAGADQSAVHTVRLSPATNVKGCPVSGSGCTAQYETVTAPAGSFPAGATVAVAECNFGGLGDPADPGLCDNRAGHPVFTKTDADGALTQLYDQNGNPTGFPVKIMVVTGKIGVPSPILGGTSRTDTDCPPTDAMRAVGRDCGIVVADITGGTINHIGAAALWFQPSTANLSVTGTTVSAGGRTVALKGNHWWSLQTTDALTCAANGMVLTGSPTPTCFLYDAIRLYHGNQLIGAVPAVGSHGQWTGTALIPFPPASGTPYVITAKGSLSNASKSLTFVIP